MIPDSMIERAARAIRGRIGDDLVDDDYCQVVAQAALGAALQDAEIGEGWGVRFYYVPEGKDGLMVAFDSRAWTLDKPGRYLVIPLGDET